MNRQEAKKHFDGDKKMRSLSEDMNTQLQYVHRNWLRKLFTIISFVFIVLPLCFILGPIGYIQEAIDEFFIVCWIGTEGNHKDKRL